ncbi:MAG: hypothetical protein AAF512_13820 [Pseudomonadota bacterium]
MLTVLVLVPIIIIATMIWQHFRYLDIRRNIVQDRQPVMYSSDVFHTVTFFAVADSDDVIDAARDFVNFLEQQDAGELIYVGQAAFTNGNTSVSARPWDGVVMMQYPSREAFTLLAQQDNYNGALGKFIRTFTHGMHRPQGTNIMLPQILLITSIIDRLKGNALAPLEPISEVEINSSPRSAQLRGITRRLHDVSTVNDEALVVFNLQRAGTPEQQAKDQQYGKKMITRMAHDAHGPMHMGQAIMLNDNDPDFEQVIIVYYPGANYFADLISSQFFQGIIGDKQLGKNLSVPTVPILRQIRQ